VRRSAEFMAFSESGLRVRADRGEHETALMDDNREMYLFVREPYPTEGSVAVEKHNRRQAKRLMAALRPLLPERR
jgi:hypothetical protein